MTGLILSSTRSGSGKTLVTLGLLRSFRQRGISVRGAKSGPDYIDPRFHEAACGAPCLNLDAWAMSPGRIRELAWTDDLLLIEGAMGLFDGAPPDGRGATADLARILRIPVVLIIDVARIAHSVAPLVSGFAQHDAGVEIVGIVLNRVGSVRHERLLRIALKPSGIPVLGSVLRRASLAHPSRYLGLMQAQEHPDLEEFLESAAEVIGNSIDLDALLHLAGELPKARPATCLEPPAQRIAIAQDAAFAFSYPHLLNDWRRLGSEIVTFSPLADEPVPDADLIMLPGGYPELYAGQITSADNFMYSLRKAAQHTLIYGECGGYMVLGESLVDSNGIPHRMAGLLPLHTSIAEPELHLGYRRLSPLGGPFRTALAAHEFHYATTMCAKGNPLFRASDAEGVELPPMGLSVGRVSGSFAHVIDLAK